MAQAVRERRHQRSGNASGSRPQTNHGLLGRGGHQAGDRTGPAEREQGQGRLAASQRQGGQRVDVQAFFIRIGARYKRIRKRPRGKPSPQLYEYKVEKLQELEQKAEEGKIELYNLEKKSVSLCVNCYFKHKKIIIT